MRRAILAAIALVVLQGGCQRLFALNPSLDISQYAHTAWTAQNGYSLGNIYAMAQTPDGYLWLGGEFGLFRFDGVRSIPWQPPAGQQLPGKPFSLLVTRDGALWIGTYAGLVSWSGGKLTRYPELDGLRVTSLLEDREGTVWAGALDLSLEAHTGRLCAMRNGSTQCWGKDGLFGSFVQGLHEDRSGALWAGAESGLWRWMPGPPRRYATLGVPISDLSKANDGRVLVAIQRAGLRQVAGDRVETYPIRDPLHPDRLLGDRDLNSNKLLWDRDGGLWIGTRDHGLFHVHKGKTDVFTKSDGLSGDSINSLFEDREGNVWVDTAGGLDRFRDLPVTAISLKQRVYSNDTNSVLAATDGSMWAGTWDGLARWKNGQITFFLKSSGLPDNNAQSLFQDDRGRIWVFTKHGLAYFKDGRFVAVNGGPSGEVYSITGDKAGNLWLSGDRGLSHVVDGHLVEHFPWVSLGRREQAKVVIADQGGVWISFRRGGGVAYFKDGQVRASYTAANGLGKGTISDLHMDRDGALWAATEEGGLSRIKDGRIATLTTGNGLPCDTILSTIEDNERSFWLYTACGLVRIARPELDAWIADPKHQVETTIVDAADGVRLRPFSPNDYGPPAAKSADGKLWFLTGEGVQVVDPRHLFLNKLPPPVHIEKIVADHKIYWQNLLGATVSDVRLPPRIHDLQIDFTALSLVAPEKVHFKYMLEGQDRDWRGVVNDRQVQYSNLAPGDYRFRVIACNNSGVWNEQGDTLEFSVAPAYYQTIWFRVAAGTLLLALTWAVYYLRVRSIQRRNRELTVLNCELERSQHNLQESEGKLAEAQHIAHVGHWSYDVAADRFDWSDETYRILGLPPQDGILNRDRVERMVHPEDRQRVNGLFESTLSGGQPYEVEHRMVRPNGEIRFVQIRGNPITDDEGRPLRIFGAIQDITERKHAEEALRRLNRELRAISDCNQVLVRATNEQELLNEICNIVCDKADYRMAWVGYIEPGEAKTVRPVAWAGAEKGYLEGANIVWADNEHGRGPTGTSIRTGNTVTSQDFATDPLVVPWREMALQRGCRSCIAMPLKDESGTVFGAFTVHSAEPYAFTDEEIRLLEELAGDMAFGITVLRGRIERKQAYDEIRQLNAELEERVRQRTAQLETANKELESFSYTVSHDLRAPLRHISAFSRMLMEEHGGQLPEEGHKLLEGIEQGTLRMGGLIEGLLKLSRLGRQEICFSAVSLDPIVKSVVEELSPDWKNRLVEWRIGALPEVQGDADLLRQVFQNLIANALKFSRDRSPAIIEIGAMSQNGHNTLYVRDNGVGFDMRYADKLFGAFQRLHRAEAFEGTGIGLATVQRIVQRHGGKIWAEAKVGEGATFFFTCAK